MSKLLDTTKLFVFLNDNQFYRQVFVFLPQALKNFLYDTPSIDTDHMHKLIDKYTQEFCDSLYKQGKVIFDLFSLVDNNNNVGLGNDKKYITIAMAIGHPFILEENQREIINIVMNVGNSLKNKMLAEIKQLYDGRQTEKFDFLATTSPASW